MADEVALHVVMGGAGETQRQWRLDMYRPAIVVGTVDSLVSKALNRGYGIARAAYPIDFALVTNGAHWVIDEIQLCPESTTTLRQLAGFAKAFGTAEPFGLTCMSATVPAGLLDTVDNPVPGPGEVVAIEPSERTGELATRLDAGRIVSPLAAEPGDYPSVAAAVADMHRTGTLTLAVFNTVAAAREVHKTLRRGPVPCTLLHSRFRAVERATMGRITEPPGETGDRRGYPGGEAGHRPERSGPDYRGGPVAELVQRAGRCNRTGSVKGPSSGGSRRRTGAIRRADVKAAGRSAQPPEGEPRHQRGPARPRRRDREQVAVLRRTDFVGLFDTAPDRAERPRHRPVRPGRGRPRRPARRGHLAPRRELATGARPPTPSPARPWRCRVPLGR